MNYSITIAVHWTLTRIGERRPVPVHARQAANSITLETAFGAQPALAVHWLLARLICRPIHCCNTVSFEDTHRVAAIFQPRGTWLDADAAGRSIDLPVIKVVGI